MGLGQYIKDTRGELRHVAWPTQSQTIIFTVLVVVLSVFVSLYLGLFDYIFTGAIKRIVSGGAPIEITQTPVSTSSSAVTPSAPTLSTSTNFR
jgi:preprotein translocase SecE subunit